MIKARAMNLTPAQFSVLHLLKERGPKEAVEVRMPPTMDGTRKVRLEWNAASGPTLAFLERAGLVSVVRTPLPTPVNAVGAKGRARRALMISITEAGCSALTS